MYSKALALCGLGVLAGAGALVDYWPVSVRYPFAAAPSGTVMSEPDAPPPVAAGAMFAKLDSLFVAAPAPAPPRPAMVRAAAAPTRTPAPDIVNVSDLYASLPVVAVGYDLGAPLDVAALPEPAYVSVRHELPVVEAAPVEVMQSATSRHLPGPYVPRLSALEDEDGFLSSAFRKTGSSIVRTGVKTGSSVVGAVRVVGSVVRRAWPN